MATQQICLERIHAIKLQLRKLKAKATAFTIDNYKRLRFYYLSLLNKWSNRLNGLQAA